MNNDDFTVLVSGGGRCPSASMCTAWPTLSKWLIEYSNESASDFALSLNIPQQKLFRWFRRLQLWATGDWLQLHHNNAPAHASCLLQSFGGKHQITLLLQPILGTLQLLAFPQTKITFEKEAISELRWDSGKYSRAADGHSENYVRSQGVYFEGAEASMSYVQCFFCLVFSFKKKSLFFIVHDWIPSGQTSYIHICSCVYTSPFTPLIYVYTYTYT